MTERLGRKTGLFLVLILAASSLLAENIKNWPAPATWSPTRSSGLSTQDVTIPLPFIGLAPCRIVDTRGGAPITGGIFTGGSDVRNYLVAGICGIPSSARALSLNFTVTGPGQTVPGFLLAWPTGGAVPPVSILNWDHVPAQIANAAVVPTNASVSFTVNVSAPTHVIIDVNGYYAFAPANTSSAFVVENDSAGNGAIVGINFNSSGTGVLGASSAGIGVVGQSTSNFGVLATSSSNVGAKGVSTSYNGVWAESASWDALAAFGGRDGGYLQGARHGVVGASAATTGVTFGAIGSAPSLTDHASGVLGVGGSPAFGSTLNGITGVIGIADGGSFPTGVFGIATGFGVAGTKVNSAGTIQSYGYLGYSATDGIYTPYHLTAVGGKSFVEPHPTDATKVIKYVCAEGPEQGTYFRGTAQTINNEAVINVPDDFRIVTDMDGLTVQLTPVGTSASMYIVSEDLNQIVVHSDRDVRFHYMVNGVRKAYKNWNPIQDAKDNAYFIPDSADARLPNMWPEEIRRRLISNGTYNPDGTVNMETAQRVGWAKVWADREAQTQVPAAQPAAAVPAPPRRAVTSAFEP